ncbi:putative phospholipid translocase non-catalytic subunit CRF1 [Cucumispora dikerogammari]|nr:putative phospholipid translocase non-catalytic subunit CRF1 [Cucumispora dikerogammari]
MNPVQNILTLYYKLITRTHSNKMAKPNFYIKSLSFFIASVIFLAYGLTIILVHPEIFNLSLPYASPTLDEYKVGIVKKNGELVNYNNSIRDPMVFNSTVKTTTLNFELKKYIKTLNVYFEITGFSQNSFTYIKQDPTSQIKTGKSSEKYEPFYKNKNRLIFPAGIMAHTFLQDRFEIFGPDKTLIDENLSDIVTDPVVLSDKARQKLLEDNVIPPSTWQGRLDSDGLADISDPRFQVWIKPHTLNTFNKLYGRYNDLYPGNYTLVVKSTFPYGKTKKIILVEDHIWTNNNGNDGIIKGSLIVGIAVLNCIAGIFYLHLSH